MKKRIFVIIFVLAMSVLGILASINFNPQKINQKNGGIEYDQRK